VNYFARTAKHDTELGGRRIRKEDKVVRWYTSASRDEALHEQPDRFDITRNGISHCAFGGGGRHFRLGAGLARLELKVLFEELTRRMPDVRRAGEVQRLGSSWANALTSLPIEFTPGAREADADGTHARTDARESAGAREPRAGHEAVGAGADGAVQEGSRR
jgi:cholest-4-en-3-one 26-monooxygenase